MLFYIAKLEKDKSVYEKIDYAECNEKTRAIEYNKDEVKHFVGNFENNPVVDFYIGKEESGERKIAFACNRVNFSMEIIMAKLVALVKQSTDIDYKLRDIKEILVSEYEEICGITRRDDKIGLYCYSSNSIEEYFCNDSHTDCSLSRRDKLCLLINSELEEEVQRISSPKNKKLYLGSFLHYIIKTDVIENSQTMLEILLGTLYANNRLLSRKYVVLSFDNQRFFSSGDLDDVIQLTSGATVVFNFIGSSDINRNLAVVQNIINKCSKDILFVFLVNRDNNTVDSFCKRKNIKTLAIKDGTEIRENAVRFVNCKMSASKIAEYANEDVETYIPEIQRYDYKALQKAYTDYYDNVIMRHFYGAYTDVKSTPSEELEPQQELSVEECYKELDSIIGLEVVKTLLKRITTVAKYNKCREKAKLAVAKQAMHMCFKGNPGTAKTTMARLLGKFLKAEGVLSNGTFVECGRADLVGKYVGWTAPAVKSKFVEAQGGVLFIDEAYSLVEDGNSFATEAIDTIIAEMENHRDDVIVIFAGYPDKMEAFLNMNEGLRSRVPYHIDFPDYSEKELLEILLVLAQQQGYSLTDEAKDVAEVNFAAVIKQKDFGNGRYVRNMLEKAIMKHAENVMNSGLELNDQQMTVLEAEDFEKVKVVSMARESRKIGFDVE